MYWYHTRFTQRELNSPWCFNCGYFSDAIIISCLSVKVNSLTSTNYIKFHSVNEIKFLIFTVHSKYERKPIQIPITIST